MTYFPPYYVPKSRKLRHAGKNATAYRIVPTLDEAMRIVNGAQSKCRVSHELRKKKGVGSISV